MNYGVVYALCDPRLESGVRYVGKTVTTGLNRRNGHVYRAMTDRTRKAEWIRGLQADGIQPQFRVLEVAFTRLGLALAERSWIAFYRARGVDLTNMSSGGEGVHGFTQSPESIKKSADKRRGRKMPPEVCEKNRIAHLNQTFSAEHRRKISEAGKGRAKSAEWRARMSALRRQMPEAIRCRKHTPETRAKMSAAHLARTR